MDMNFDNYSNYFIIYNGKLLSKNSDIFKLIYKNLE